MNRAVFAAALACAAAGLAACGGPAAPVQEGGAATALMGTAPDSLDPQEGHTSRSAEATWISYTPLLTYRHAEGSAGTELIPGLARALPDVSADGLTYELQLRPHLVYSNGRPVKAGDFAHTIERAIKLGWRGKSFFTSNIEGAAAYESGAADTISGITSDDRTGRITIRLVRPYGPFANVLAFPAAGLVPSGTPMRSLSNHPPPGVGPYRITRVRPDRSFTLVKNRRFAGLHIPGIPLGHLDRITVNIASDLGSEAEQVLQNEADAFDPSDTLPPPLLPQIEAEAHDRFTRETLPSAFYFFLNTRTKPFDNPLARQAVNLALDRRVLVRLASGFLEPTCFFLPAGIAGHPTGPCPYGDPNAVPDVAKAKALVRRARLVGTPVTVWGQEGSPRRQFAEYYASVLNEIGFEARPKIIGDSDYFRTIGNAKTAPQTGFAERTQDFPNPSDFYLPLDGDAIRSTDNQNLSMVDDPHIQSELERLGAVPATSLASVTSEWQKLDEYVARKAYVAAFGSEEVPKFLSDDLDFGSAIFHPVYMNDWTSWQLTF